LVLSPEHELIKKLESRIQNLGEVEKYIEEAKNNQKSKKSFSKLKKSSSYLSMENLDLNEEEESSEEEKVEEEPTNKSVK
jgi:hypothetical protein